MTFQNTIPLLVFAKTPANGAVKTRLQPVYPESFSKQLHIALVNFCLSQWEQVEGCDIEIKVAGDIPSFQEQIPKSASFPLVAQRGDDLGQRMAFALSHALQSAKGAIVVGTDCPFIDRDYLEMTMEALESADIVIGPASDGGYVLLAARKFEPSFFNNITWGSELVFEQTLSAIKKAGFTYTVLPTLADIDRPEDIQLLAGLQEFKAFTSQTSPHTLV